MDIETTQKVLAIVGPTAVGKTKVAQQLAIELAGELISADSMQIYKHLDIGTDKPTEEEQKAFTYHCLNIIEPSENFSVAQYQKEARKAIGIIAAKGRLPILVGGTGLYIRAACDNLYFPSGKLGSEIRTFIESEVDDKNFLYELLINLDPETASKIHPNNIRRITRALEVIYQTGIPFSEYQNKWNEYESIFDLELIGLFLKRRKLIRKIDERVEQMFTQGIIQETEKILNNGIQISITAQQAIGYSQVIDLLLGKKSLEEAKEEIKTKTRQYAKRQITWFQKDTRIKWIDVDELNLDDIMQKTYEHLLEVNFI